MASAEELAFFDRVRKYINNRQNMNEFLKLCNMFAQDLLDKAVLVNKVAGYIGGNPELMSWYMHFVQFDGKQDQVVARAKPPRRKVNLSNCRAYGPSYRLLPKRVCGANLHLRTVPFLALLTRMWFGQADTRSVAGAIEILQRP